MDIRRLSLHRRREFLCRVMPFSFEKNTQEKATGRGDSTPMLAEESEGPFDCGGVAGLVVGRILWPIHGIMLVRTDLFVAESFEMHDHHGDEYLA